MSDLAIRPQELGIGRLFETVRDALIVANAQTGRIVLWNPSATEVFGYSPSEALEMSVEALVPGPLKTRHRAGMARYRDTGHGPYIDSRAALELPAVRKGGAEISVELTLSPIEPVHDSGAEGRFVLAIVRDVTERKRTEEVLRTAKRRRPAQITKSNLILGMGERPEEVAEAMGDLAATGCNILTMGQYLQPTRFHLPVDRWVTPEEFAEHKRVGESLGLTHVEAGPLVRSSYHAGKQLERAVAAG
jgi:PAS domain S-box-containing protein